VSHVRPSVTAPEASWRWQPARARRRSRVPLHHVGAACDDVREFLPDIPDGLAGAHRLVLIRRALASRVADPATRTRKSVAQHDAQEGAVDLEPAVVLDEAELPELVHEEVHPGPRRPDHLGQRLL
jgi:hypothetical protein